MIFAVIAPWLQLCSLGNIVKVQTNILWTRLQLSLLHSHDYHNGKFGNQWQL